MLPGRVLKWLCSAALCLLVANAWAAQQSATLVLNDQSGATSLAGHVELLIDPTQRSTAAAVANGQAGPFRPVADLNENYGFRDDAFWLRFTLAQADSRPRDWLLKLKHAYHDSVDLYVAERDGPKLLSATGDRMAFANRDVAHRHFVFRFHLEDTAPRTFYLRIQSTGSVSFPLQVWAPLAFAQHASNEQIVFGVYYGIMMAVFIYSLLLCAWFRERLYVYFTAHVAAFGLFMAITSGHGFQYLWPMQSIFASQAHSVFVLLTLATGGAFLRQFLATAVYVPRLDPLMHVTIHLPLAQILLVPLLPIGLSGQAAILSALFCLLVWVGIGVHLLRAGITAAQVFAIVFTAELAGAAVVALNRLGFLPTSTLAEHTIPISALVEVVFLAGALSTRINRLRKEKESAQAALLAAQREALIQATRHQEELEARVSGRTKQLVDAIGALEQEIDVRRQAESMLRASEERMRHMAQHDALTGLPNRRLIVDRMDQAIAHAQRKNGLAALLMIDLDRFKYVNDTHGHGVGDHVLVEVAKRLERNLRRSDSVGRLSGDEFVVVAEDLESEEDAARVAEKILISLCEPLYIDAHLLQIGASIGIALYPRDATDASSLLARADTAMYRAKSTGRNRFVSARPGSSGLREESV